MARKKAKKVTRHPRLRTTCSICGKTHSKGEHGFHGIGAYGTSRSIENIAKATAKRNRKRKKK